MIYLNYCIYIYVHVIHIIYIYRKGSQLRDLKSLYALTLSHFKSTVARGLEVHEGARRAREDLGHKEGLAQEALHLRL